MKKAVRAIIVDKDQILVMKRNKFGKEYYVLIGGHVELGESLEKALYREIHEETMIHVSNPKLVYIEEATEPYGTQYIYTCQYVSGQPVLHPESDEIKINRGGQNIYTPMWLPISRLGEVPFLPANLAEHLIDHLQNGFPEETLHFKADM